MVRAPKLLFSVAGALVLGGSPSHPWGGLFICSIDIGALDPEMNLSAPTPVAFVDVDARGSGTGNPPVEVVTSTVFGPPRGT